MKLTAVFLLAASLQVAARTDGQTVTLKVKNAPLKEVFRKIQQQTGLNVMVDVAILEKAGRVTMEVRDMPVSEVLNACFKNEPLSYSIVDERIVVKRAATGAFQPPVTAADPHPPGDISGRVTDENNHPLQGATIKVKGGEQVTTTDAKKRFLLKGVNEHAMLEISYVGYETLIMAAGNKRVLSVVLKVKVTAIDEVQVIGYGTTTKRMNTGTVATLKGAEIKDRPVSNVLQALQGKLPGVAITNSYATLGSPVQLTIRGVNSITSGTNPLIIIDGVIINSTPGGLIASASNVGSTQGATAAYFTGNSPLNMINPNDIESVDVLKDADATSIYGSRGTNGVILITTKKASLGKTKVDVNLSTGWKSATGITKRMNTEQYLQMRKDAFATGNMTASSVINPITPTTQNAPDLLTWSQTAYTDFPKMEVGNNAPNYNADVTMSGGTKALNFLASAGYYKMYDIYMFKPYQERMTGRMQINHASADNRFHFNLGTIFGIENQTFSTFSLNNAGVGRTNTNAPNFPLYKPDGSLNFGAGQGYTGGSYFNPLGNKDITSNSKTNNLLLTGEMSYTIIKGFTAKTQVTFNSQANEYHQFFPSTVMNTQVHFPNVPTGYHSTNKFTSVNIEPQLIYSGSLSKANITALAGATFLNKQTGQIGVKVVNPGSDDLLASFASGKPTATISNNTAEKFESVFGRLTLDWDRKYLANFSMRRDGSSRFGPANHFANFAAAGLAWIFTSENFFRDNVRFLSYGKLRGSHGTTGNNNIPDYQYLSLVQPASGIVYNGNPLLGPVNYSNSGIKWEKTTKNDIGLELGLLKNRILVTATWYRSISTDLLVSLPLAAQSGYSSYYGNFPGKVQNTGLEFELTTKNTGEQSNVQWTTKFNLTVNKNMLKSFPGLEQSVYANTYQIGRALPGSDEVLRQLEMPYHFTGIDPATGLPQFLDLNKDGAITSTNDANTNAAWWGPTTPTTWGGITNTLRYKGFSLDVFMQFSNGIFSNWHFSPVSQVGIGAIYNPSTDVVGNYWMKPGDVKKYPRLYTGVSGASAYTQPINIFYPYSTAVLYKGYYIRLKNVQLTWNLPARILSKIKTTNASLYLSGENLAVFTPVKLHKDPESTFTGETLSGSGPMRSITMGIRLGF